MKLPRIVNAISAGVFALLIIAYLAGWLGESPIRTAQLWTGRIAYVFLLASLSITPLRTVTGNAMIIPLRKTFGLNAFYYAFLHMLVFTGLNFQFNLAGIIEAIGFRKFIIPGAVALLILTVMAITTIDPVKKAVKKVWRKIHWWVYPANILVLLHYAGVSTGNLQIKPLPLIAAVYVGLLFLLRVHPVKKAIIRWRQG